MRTFLTITCVIVFAGLTSALPTIITLDEGQSLTATVLTYAEEIQQCYLITPSNETIEFKPNNESNEKYALQEDILNVSQCNVEVREVTSNDDGLWSLYAVASTGTIHSQSYNLTVKKPDEIIPEYLDQRTVQTSLNAIHRFTIQDVGFINTESCNVITPNGTRYNLREENITGIELHTLSDVACGVKITIISEDFVGNWTLVAIGTRMSAPIERRLPIVIAVEAPAEASPRLVTVAEGNNIHISLANSTTVPETCKLFRPQGTEYQVNISEAMSNTCSYSVNNVSAEDNGTWIIVFGDRITYKAPVEVVVVGSPDTNGTQMVVWTLDRPVEQTIGPDDAIYCKITDPRRNTVFEGFGRCNISISRVTSEHTGVWKMSLGMHGSVLPVETQFRVDVIQADPKPIVRTNVVVVNQTNVSITCSVQSQFAIKACKFRDPSGRVLLAHDGISQSRYRSHGSTVSYQTVAQTHTCGLHIADPAISDVGLWRCGVETEGQIYYGHMAVRCPWLTRDPEIAATIITKPTLSADHRSVTALVDESVTLSCSIQAPIRYCYFRGRNGTIYHVSPDQSNYVGAGFDAGECGIRFSGLSSSASGFWSCHVGLTDAPAPVQHRQISVSIIEPLTVRQRGGRDMLRIEAQVYQLRRIDYCVFVRNDGLGFTMDNAPRGYYLLTYPSSGSCELRIASPTNLDYEDWTVLVKISGQDSEISQVVYLAPRTPDRSPMGFRFPTVWVVVMVIGLSMVLVTIVLGPSKNRKWASTRAASLRDSFRNSFKKSQPNSNTTAMAA